MRGRDSRAKRIGRRNSQATEFCRRRENGATRREMTNSWERGRWANGGERVRSQVGNCRGALGRDGFGVTGLGRTGVGQGNGSVAGRNCGATGGEAWRSQGRGGLGRRGGGERRLEIREGERDVAGICFTRNLITHKFMTVN